MLYNSIEKHPDTLQKVLHLLFSSAFGPEPIFQRLSKGEAKLLLTSERL